MNTFIQKYKKRLKRKIYKDRKQRRGCLRLGMSSEDRGLRGMESPGEVMKMF